MFYGAGASANAAKIAGYLGVTAAALASLHAGHVEVLLGTGSTTVPAGLAPAASPTATPSAGSTSGNNGAAGSAVPSPERQIRNTLRLLTYVHILGLMFQLRVLTPRRSSYVLDARRRLIAGKVGYGVSCFLAAVLLVVSGYAHKAVADLSALGERDHDRRQLIRRRDEHPGDGLGEPDQLPGPVPFLEPADRDARGQRGLLRGSDGWLPGHGHADPDAHLRGRPEGGRFLDPARRPWSPIPRPTTTAITTGKIDQAYYFAYVVAR